MPQFVAFLRGLNVGGHRVRMQDLRRHFTEMGFSDVTSLLASGNIIFTEATAGEVDTEDVAERIETHLADALGYAVPAFVRTAPQVRAIAESEPFPPDVAAASKGKLQVALLRTAPDQGARDRVLALSTDDDRLAIDGRELFWLPSGGTQQSALNFAEIDRDLGVNTMRTKNTIERIASTGLTTD